MRLLDDNSSFATRLDRGGLEVFVVKSDGEAHSQLGVKYQCCV